MGVLCGARRSYGACKHEGLPQPEDKYFDSITWQRSRVMRREKFTPRFWFHKLVVVVHKHEQPTSTFALTGTTWGSATNGGIRRQ